VYIHIYNRIIKSSSRKIYVYILQIIKYIYIFNEGDCLFFPRHWSCLTNCPLPCDGREPPNRWVCSSNQSWANTTRRGAKISHLYSISGAFNWKDKLLRKVRFFVKQRSRVGQNEREKPLKAPNIGLSRNSGHVIVKSIHCQCQCQYEEPLALGIDEKWKFEFYNQYL